jgi:hypothetical protein
VAKFNPSGSFLVWGTYYGGKGTSDLEQYGIAIDASGCVFTTGTTSDTTGIATVGAYKTSSTGSNAFIAKFCASLLLPVELRYFNCAPASNSIVLNWATATETNNKHFTIERSGDGVTFNPIATIPGAGNSSEANYYEYTDGEPLSGDNYYRLTQTDYDGAVHYCSITECNTASDTLIVFPNPTRGIFSVMLPYSASNESSSVSITNMVGQIVYTTAMNNGTQKFNIDISQLPSSIYIVTITNSFKTYRKKLVLTH